MKNIKIFTLTVTLKGCPLKAAGASDNLVKKQ